MRTKRQKPTAAQLALVSGEDVDVRQDNGEILRMKTRSEPWQLGHGEWVILLDGRSGGYMLTRCQPARLQKYRD